MSVKQCAGVIVQEIRYIYDAHNHKRYLSGILMSAIVNHISDNWHKYIFMKSVIGNIE